ncbi:hypothetical protein [Streptomyces sp. NPDC058964]|uniref:hypothetical protein n=1 Tax=Streptomyces sp. NPDC058964 TaxID=3346681 RepID=UPI00368A32DD
MRLNHTIPFVHHATDRRDVGEANGVPVTDYGIPGGRFSGRFSGRIEKVVREIGDDLCEDPAGETQSMVSVQ